MIGRILEDLLQREKQANLEIAEQLRQQRNYKSMREEYDGRPKTGGNTEDDPLLAKLREVHKEPKP